MKIEMIDRKFVDVDPESANHYLTFNVFPVQRNINRDHVKELSEKMLDGRFRFGEIAFVGMDGQKEQMMNGQHVCHAIILSGITIPCVVERFRAADKRDVSELFRQFEIRPRSINDFIRVEADALNLNWPLRISRLIVSAAALDIFLKGGAQSLGGRSFSPGGHINKDQRASLLIYYKKEGDFVHKLLIGENCKHLFRAPVLCSIFWSYRKSEPDAKTFWDRVRDGENLTKDMSEMKLREFLKTTYSTIPKLSYRTITGHEYMYRCILAWNAFRTNKRTNLSYSFDKPLPKMR